MRSLMIGTFSVPYYGLILLLSAVIAALWTYFRARKEKESWRGAGLFALLALLLGFLCAWLGYGLVNLNWVMEHGAGAMLQSLQSRLLPYGAVIGCVLAALLAAKRCECSAFALLDAASAPLCLMTALTRLAEPLAGMGFGRNIYDWFDPWMEESMIAWEDPSALFRFPFAMQDHYGEWNFNISILEALTALVLLVICLCMEKRKAGGRFLLVVMGCAALQIAWESMRQDAVMRWGFVRANQLLSAVAVMACAAACYAAMPKKKRSGGKLALVLTGEVLCAGVAMAMEFALEKKIDFLVFLRMDACYLIMLAACAGMVLLALPLWKKAFLPIKK